MASGNDARQTIQDIENAMRQQLEDTARSARAAIFLKALLLVFVLAYMSWLHANIRTIDADEVMATLSANLKSEMPNLVVNTSRDLKASAPETVKALRKDLIISLPAMREEAEAHVVSMLEPFAKDLEQGMTDELGALIEVYKAEVDKANPSLSDEQKLDRVFELIRRDFKDIAKKVAESRAGEFSQDLQKLEKQIARLREGKNLNAREKHERDLLRVWVKLVHAKKKSGEIPEVHHDGGMPTDDTP